MARQRKADEREEEDDHSGDSLENQLSKAGRVYTEADDELQGAYRQLQSIRTQYEQAYDNSEDTTSLQFHLQQAEKRCDRAEKRYDKAEKRYEKMEARYRELNEDAQRSTTAGEIHATHLTSPSCFLSPQRHPCVCSASDRRRLLLAISRH